MHNLSGWTGKMRKAGAPIFFRGEIRFDLGAALAFSFLLHTFVFLISLNFALNPVPMKEPIVLDLTSIASHPQEGDVHNSSKPNGKRRIQGSPSVPAGSVNSPREDPVNHLDAASEVSVSDKDPLPVAVGIELTEAKAPAGNPRGGLSDMGPDNSSHLDGPSTKGNFLGHQYGRGTSDDGAQDVKEQLKRQYMAEHFSYIRNIILGNLTYPRKARIERWAGTVIVSFIILETGRVENIRILKSSGYELLDVNVVETINAIGAFPKPPVKAELHIPVLYRLDF
jgi:periplasmic protein TonB